MRKRREIEIDLA